MPPLSPRPGQSSIGQELKSRVKAKRKGPIWDGPESNTLQGGVTQSLLSRFLVCRERFRLKVIEGLEPADDFSHRLEYGNYWHAAEEAHALGQPWQPAVEAYLHRLLQRYPLRQEQVCHWYSVCLRQFPLYVKYWKDHPDVEDRLPLLSEKTFSVPYELPSGRTVYLRGKWDSVDLVTKGQNRGIWLQENKSKGDIKELQLQRQLTFDLQTMLYMVALDNYDSVPLPNPIRGVRYNVVRRPLSGGKGSIVRHKPSKSNPQGESLDEFYTRVAAYIEAEPEHYFMRWNVPITREDLDKFKRQFLNPVLEQLCDWYDWVSFNCRTGGDPFADRCNHWRHPFGVYNPMDEGGASEYDAYLNEGSMVGLSQSTGLFPELQ